MTFIFFFLYLSNAHTFTKPEEEGEKEEKFMQNPVLPMNFCSNFATMFLLRKKKWCRGSFIQASVSAIKWIPCNYTYETRIYMVACIGENVVNYGNRSNTGNIAKATTK